MKTAEEAIREIDASSELRDRLLAAKNKKEVTDLFRSLGCEASGDEIGACIQNKLNGKKEIPEEDLDRVTGGMIPIYFDAENFNETKREEIETMFQTVTEKVSSWWGRIWNR